MIARTAVARIGHRVDAGAVAASDASLTSGVTRSAMIWIGIRVGTDPLAIRHAPGALAGSFHARIARGHVTGVPTPTAMDVARLGVHAGPIAFDVGCVAFLRADSALTDLPWAAGVITRTTMGGVRMGIDAASVAQGQVAAISALTGKTALARRTGVAASATVRGIGVGIRTSPVALRHGRGTRADSVEA